MSYIYRPARMTDVFSLVDILDVRQADSRYADNVEVDKPYARKMLAGLIQRNGGTNEGGTFVHVAVKDGKVTAFVAASLSRIYGIGVYLGACDHFLIGYADCPPSVLDRLLDAYIEWASNNPKVVEIGASWSDAIPGSERFDLIYPRKGFSPCARTFRRVCSKQVKEIAA